MPTRNRLHVGLERSEYPYSDPIDMGTVAWGKITITVIIKGSDPPYDHQMQVPLLQTQWDIAELARWFDAITGSLYDELPSADGWPSALPHESLSQALQRLVSREFAEDEEEAQDEWDDALYRFRTQHSLRFAMRGARIPDIIIGYNQGSGEISLRRQEPDDDVSQGDWSFLGAWAYPFDLGDFRDHLKREIQRLIPREIPI